MLKGCAPSICGPLSTLFNTSLKTGSVPDDWKVSNITPIYKAGEVTKVSNYRPFHFCPWSQSCLRELSTMLFPSIPPTMACCLSGSSTQEAILSALKIWHEALERKESVGCVFFDISKAFDSLPHSFIIAALSRAGVCGPLLMWFRSYLSGRRERVVLEGVSSSLVEVSSGVPQGSILGPLLFLLTVNPITEISISRGAELLLFAHVFRSIKCNLDQTALQSDATLIEEWMSTRNLRLSSSKTKCMVISRQREPPVLALKVSGQPIEQVKTYKYLGVTISEDLSWGLHINNSCNKAKRLLGFLYRSVGQGNILSLTAVQNSGTANPQLLPPSLGSAIQDAHYQP